MLLTSFDPFAQDFDRLAQRIFGTADGRTRGSLIPVDVLRGEDDVTLRFDLPGVDADSLDVTADRGVLTVRATRTEELAEGTSVVTRERFTGSAARRVYLADTLDTDKIEARYVNGVLTVVIPVKERARPRKVEIQAGDQKKITA